MTVQFIDGNMTSDEALEDGEEEKMDEPIPDEQILEIEYENAKRRLGEQRETLKEFSNEGARYIRLLLLFIGTPLAILGALDPDTLLRTIRNLTSTECVVTFPVDCLSANLISILVGITLIFSIVTNILAGGFEARGIYNATDPNDLQQTIHFDNSASEYLQDRLKDYRDRIEHNDRVIHTEESLLVGGKFTLILAVYGLGTLAYALLTEVTIQFVIWIGILAALWAIIFLPLIYLPSNYMQSDRFIRFNPLYDTEYESGSEKTNDDSETQDISDSEKTAVE